MIFAVASASLVVLMVLGLVALNALLAQTSFKIDDLQTRVDNLTQVYDRQLVEVARLGSPQRVAREANRLGLSLPADGIQVLHVPSGPPPARSKSVVEGRP